MKAYRSHQHTLLRWCVSKSRAALWIITIVGAAWITPHAAAQQSAAIASAHPLASAAGHSILDSGGNAFDAAIAVAAALAVVEPYSSGLGGGGFFLLHRASDRFEVMIDARETAPAEVKQSHYFDAEGRPIPAASRQGGTAVAIPGLPAGLAHLAQRYGKLPLASTLAPAARLAREGFKVDSRYAQIARLREEFLRTGVNTQAFLDGGEAPQAGFLLQQPALAYTVERIGRMGAAGFYEGPTAQAMIDAVNSAGGVWRASDLSAYKVIEREPVRFKYRGALITSAALPSAGGMALAQTLGMLQMLPFGRLSEPATDHLVAEALRRAFRDRERYLGDPGFVEVPMNRLVSHEYLKQLASDINLARASSAPETKAGARIESENTTHFSIIDNAGNRVAATLTINLLFGAGIVPAGTGVLLNNEMDDFTLRPDVPNAFRLRGGVANGIEPRKRPLSSMTPTFVQDSKGVLILGAPGGSRIVSQVLLGILSYVGAKEVDLAHLLSLPRYHHQNWPDRIEIEPQGFSDEWIAAIRARGHEVVSANRQWGNMQAVFKPADGGPAQAASDPRGRGVAWY
jgi:gamma-glutamyltranspeptidase/glutathione hydrolase